MLPLYERLFPETPNTVASETLDAQVNALLEMAHFPLLVVSVKPEPKPESQFCARIRKILHAYR